MSDELARYGFLVKWLHNMGSARILANIDLPNKLPVALVYQAFQGKAERHNIAN
jgi:hypothetical protein